MNRTIVFLAVLLSSLSLHAADQHWVGTWAAAPSSAVKLAKDKQSVPDTTFRNIVRVSIGGSKARFRISNEHGNTSLLIGGVHVATPGRAGAIKPKTDRALLFDGAPTVIIPPGAAAFSDPIAMDIPALSDLAVTIFVPAQTVNAWTIHALASSHNYTADGNALTATEMPGAKAHGSWNLLTGIDVLADSDAAAIVTLGDSITDGAHSTADKNARWPDILAVRLHANKKTEHVAVLNEGISGNRLLHEVAGNNALNRFDRDVLSQSGVKWLIILEGINDIGHTVQPNHPDDPVTSAQLTWALNQLVTRAHTHGIKVYCATLTPFVGAKYQDAQGEAMRTAENTWIKSSGACDGFIDFDRTTQDPANPLSFNPIFDSGDHLHPGDIGYKAMGDSINLRLFE